MGRTVATPCRRAGSMALSFSTRFDAHRRSAEKRSSGTARGRRYAFTTPYTCGASAGMTPRLESARPNSVLQQGAGACTRVWRQVREEGRAFGQLQSLQVLPAYGPEQRAAHLLAPLGPLAPQPRAASRAQRGPDAPGASAQQRGRRRMGRAGGSSGGGRGGDWAAGPRRALPQRLLLIVLPVMLQLQRAAHGASPASVRRRKHRRCQCRRLHPPCRRRCPDRWLHRGAMHHRYRHSLRSGTSDEGACGLQEQTRARRSSD